MEVLVKFLGGAGSVTGSRYLITAGDFRFMVDCGLFQGLKSLRVRNREKFPIDVSTVDAIVITHAHIDHTGYLPRVVKEGFDGPVYCTKPSADLMELMLLDSAHLQMEETAFAKKKGFSRHENPEPLYNEDDAKATFKLFKPYDYNQWVEINDRVKINFRDAGHLLGSAIVEIIIKGDTEEKKLVFSGDLGRYNQTMLQPPTPIEHADILFVESTYGNKVNEFHDPAVDLVRIVRETFGRGGVLVIPAFAIGRTQSLLYLLRRLMKEDKIPDVPVYIDSPMAISATYLFYKYPAYHKLNTDKKELAEEIETNMLVFVKTADHSKSLNAIKSNAIILASSGMMTGGRIVHHMFNRLPHAQDTFLVAGYQAEGTRGRRLLDGEKTLRIFGQDVPVNCEVEFISSMSGHADKTELFQWLGNFKSKPQLTFTVHGEQPDLGIYAQSIRDTLGWNVMVPQYLESVRLFENI